MKSVEIQRATRRELLCGGAASLLWSVTGCTVTDQRTDGSALPVSGARKAQAIDIHCHIFNARDLPVRNFVHNIVFEGKRVEDFLLQPTVDFLAFIMSERSPRAADELVAIAAKSGAPAATAPRTAVPISLAGDRLRKKEVVVRALERLRRGETTAPAAPAAARAAPQGAAPAAANRQFIDYLARRYHPTAAAAPGVPGVAPRAGVLADLEGIYEGIERAKDTVSNDVDWAYRYTLYRYEILELLSRWPASGASDVKLFCPATIDYAYWLQQFDTTPLKDQVRVMEAISTLPSRPAAVHCYIAFDPWRQIAEPGTLDLVKDAIYNRGFIGVKLYPPMGFRAIGNAGLGPADFPPQLRRLTRTPGSSLDAALRRLYQWCVAEDVPIMAHCSYSQFPNAAYGQRAAPDYWETALQHYPRLRLNLGHCGGPWDMVKEDTVRPGASQWTEHVIRLLGDDRYPNLYADIADAAIVLDRDPGEAAIDAQVTTRLRELLARYSRARGRLMYGSDWSLLGREAGSEAYYGDMRDRFCASIGLTSESERAGFLGDNAARFLGLAPDAPSAPAPKTRRRLEAFYNRHGLDFAPLRLFGA